MRKFIVAVVIMIGVIFILARTAEVSEIVTTLHLADWRFILLGIWFQAGWLLIISFSYYSIYQAMEMNEKLTDLTLTVSAANFLNVVAPSAGMGGIAAFLSEARRKGAPPGRVTAANAVFILLEYIGFLCVLALGLVVLIRRSMLTTTELTATAIMVVLVSVLGCLLYLGMRSAKLLGNVLAFFVRLANRVLHPITHREYLPEHRAYSFAEEASGGLYRLRHQPNKLLLPAFLSLVSKTFQIMIFLLVFLAFRVPFSPGTIIAGWSMCYLFLTVSFTPAGLGVVEGLMPFILASMYVPLSSGTLIIFAYRGITFWLPFLFGMLAFRWLGRAEKISAPAGYI